MTTNHGKARLIIDCPNDYHCEQTVFWTLIEGELADGQSWLAEVRGLDMFTGGFGKRIVQPGCQYRLLLPGGASLSRVVLHDVMVNTYGEVSADIPLDVGGPYLGSAFVLLASPDYPQYTVKPPFDGPLEDVRGKPYIPFDYLGWFDEGEGEGAADCGAADCGTEDCGTAGCGAAGGEAEDSEAADSDEEDAETKDCGAADCEREPAGLPLDEIVDGAAWQDLAR